MLFISKSYKPVSNAILPQSLRRVLTQRVLRDTSEAKIAKNELVIHKSTYRRTFENDIQKERKREKDTLLLVFCFLNITRTEMLNRK